MAGNQKEGSVLTTQRLEAFSDGVFAIVITLLFLELRAPEIPHGGSWQELWAEIYKLAPKFSGIVVSFAFVAIFWVAHHQFFHTLRETTRGLLWLNLIFLFLVCFVPFPAAIMAEYPNNKTSVVFFGATILLTSVLVVALRWYAWISRREISGVNREHEVYKAVRRGAAIALLYAAGLAVAFFYPLAAIVMYLLTLLIMLLPVSVNVENEDSQSGEDENEKSEHEVEL